ncbi:hypothetical protein IWX91DRAFT_323889 [Phyllosticta citricarpa]
MSKLLVWSLDGRHAFLAGLALFALLKGTPEPVDRPPEFIVWRVGDRIVPIGRLLKATICTARKKEGSRDFFSPSHASKSVWVITKSSRLIANAAMHRLHSILSLANYPLPPSSLTTDCPHGSGSTRYCPIRDAKHSQISLCGDCLPLGLSRATWAFMLAFRSTVSRRKTRGR